MSVIAWNCHALIAVLWFQLEPMNQLTKRVQTPQFQAAVIYQTSVVPGITDAEKGIKLARKIPSICSGDPRKADEVFANVTVLATCGNVFFLRGGGGRLGEGYVLGYVHTTPHSSSATRKAIRYVTLHVRDWRRAASLYRKRAETTVLM